MAETTLKIDNAGYVLTVDPQRRVLRNATILVEGDRITAIDAAAALADVRADTSIDAATMLVSPGFVDTHDHLDSHMFRGLFSDAFTPTYIPDICAVRAKMTEEQAYVSTMAALTEFLCAGTTCIVTPGDLVHLHAAINAHEESGARTIVSSSASDVPNPVQVPVMETAAALAHLEETIDTYDGRGAGRIRAWVALSHATEWVSERLAVGAKEIADRRATGMTFHQAARQGQVEKCLAEHGVRPVEYLDRIGVLGSNVLLGHSLRVDDHEIELMAATDTRAAMCPSASVRIGFGTSTYGRLPEMLEAGIVVGLGTDSTEFGPADMMRAAYLAATLYTDGRLDTSMVPAETALELATIGGAKAAGLDDEIGSLEVGKKADIVLFDTQRSEWRPLLDPVSNLIYTADRHSVHTVIVDGRIRVAAGRPTFVDAQELLGRLQDGAIAASLAAGVSVERRWPIIG